MGDTATGDQARWLHTKLRNYYPAARSRDVVTLERAVTEQCAPESEPQFANPFVLDDVLVFDDDTLAKLLAPGAHGLSPEDLAAALRTGPIELADRVYRNLPAGQRERFRRARARPADTREGEAVCRLLDAFFWDLTYWKTPDLYEELTEGERLHPGIFRRLAPVMCDRVVLDAGAGTGRATLECLRHGARHVYAVEPSPGLLRLLERRLKRSSARQRVTPLRGRFGALPLPDDCVDVALSCSAFTAEQKQGGDLGLAELRRVTRPGGRIVLIWPRPQDFGWLAARGFQYVALPVPGNMRVRFRSLGVAVRVALRFYQRNRAVLGYLLRHRRPDVPFAVLGYNPPHDYCWLRVEK